MYGWNNTPNKVSPKYLQGNEQGETIGWVYEIGLYDVTVKLANGEPSVTTVRKYNHQADPRATLPNMDISDGEIRIPVTDLVSEVLKRLEPADLAKALFGTAQTGHAPNPMIGKHVVARTFTAGVHIGIVVSQHGEETYLLKYSRRLWKWEGAFTLSEVATLGINPKGSRIASAVPEILLTNVNELIPTTETARKTFEVCHEKA